MNEEPLLIIEKRPPVARITLNRPDALNPLSAETIRSITETMNQFNADDDIHIAIIGGTGRAFSSGADRKGLEKLGDASEDMIVTALKEGESMSRSITASDLIVICAAHGYCIGGGLSIALASDICLAAEGTVFFIPEVGHGLPYLWWSTPQMIAAMGIHRAKYLSLTEQRFDAESAMRFGLVSSIVPAEELMAKSWELAALLAEKPRAALLAQKRLCNRVLGAMMEATADEVSLALDCIGEVNPNVRPRESA